MVRIGIVTPTIQFGPAGSAGNMSEAIRTTFTQYLNGPNVEIVSVLAMLPMQIDAEAKAKRV